MKTVCRCSAYPFPHRLGAGACQARDEDDLLCSLCLHPSDEVVYDAGIGPYEFWGHRGWDSRPARGSRCCHHDLMTTQGERLDG